VPARLFAPTRVTATYPALSEYGLSGQGSIPGGVLSLEAGYYQSRGDEAGDDPIIPNSQVRFLVGYQRQPWDDGILTVQYYAEVMDDYDAYRRSLPGGSPEQRKYKDIVTLHLVQRMRHETWKTEMMLFFSEADDDGLLQGQATYKFSDNLAATVGANLFWGKRDFTPFGQLDRDDNLYLSVRFDF